MVCPKCGCTEVVVFDTMPGFDNKIFRRRKCKNCGERLRTVETPDDGSAVFKKEYSDAMRVKNVWKRRDKE